MKEVIMAVDRIRHMPDAIIDNNFRQGVDAVLAQLRLRNLSIDKKAAKIFGAQSERDLQTLQQLIAPFQLPEDYRFFFRIFWGGSNCNGRRQIIL